MQELSYTHILEEVVREFNISRDEYALCNYIHTWGAHPKSKFPGHCDRTLEQMADFVRITKRGLIKMLYRLVMAGLIEQNEATKKYRSTAAWADAVYLTPRKDGELSSPNDEKHGELSSPKIAEKVNFVHSDGELSSPTYKGNNKKYIDNSINSASRKKNGAAFPLFSDGLKTADAVSRFAEFLKTHADGKYKAADAAKYVADALEWATNTPQGKKARYASWETALAGWVRRDYDRGKLYTANGQNSFNVKGKQTYVNTTSVFKVLTPEEERAAKRELSETLKRLQNG